MQVNFLYIRTAPFQKAFRQLSFSKEARLRRRAFSLRKNLAILDRKLARIKDKDLAFEDERIEIRRIGRQQKKVTNQLDRVLQQLAPATA